jgi:hypothetical protein
MTGAADAMTPTTTRTGWAELPADVRDGITSKTGTVHDVEAITIGLNSAITARLDTAGGQIFLKGTRSERAAGARREARINPLVTGVSPRLRWQLEASGWHVLGFDFVNGRRADYSPASTDLPVLTTTLTRLSTITAPPDSRHVADRWSDAAQRAGADPALFAGDRLLHTDLNPHNVLITDVGAYLVDWSWPSQGAAWIDTACAALWLIAEGHTPLAAETWARSCRTWDEADPTALNAFAATQAMLWEQIADADPQPWKQRLQAAAHAWRDHRHAL